MPEKMIDQVDLGTQFFGSPSGKAVIVTGRKKTVGPLDVVIDIAFSGLCGTDLHHRKRDMALGHEGVGIVSKTGADVKTFKSGDRVGWGYNHNADLSCDYCLAGRDTMCANREMYSAFDLDQASIGDRFVIKAAFVHKIPDSIPLRFAGPLQCAGATIFGAICQADIKPYHRVGVVGIGGLGHLAIQYLRAWGCEVVAFSTSTNKKEEALKLGAHEFVCSKSESEMKEAKPVNHFVLSTDRQIPWKDYFAKLARDGTIVPLSVEDEDLKGVPYMPIIRNQFKIMGSLVADRGVHRSMLEFSARHNIRPVIEELPMTEAGVNEALDRLSQGKVRYRFVLSTSLSDPLFP